MKKTLIPVLAALALSMAAPAAHADGVIPGLGGPQGPADTHSHSATLIPTLPPISLPKVD